MKTIKLKKISSLVALSLAAFYSAGALAHGYMSSPLSRSAIQFDYQKDAWPANEVEAPKLPAGNSSPEGDNQYENLFNFPPDGKLASGNSSAPRNAILDDETKNTQMTSMRAGKQQFKWYLPANHLTTYFTYYITKPDWQSMPGAKQRLTRAMFEERPFCHVIYPYGPQGSGKPEVNTVHTCDVPERQGEQKIYAVWRIRDTAMAFYQMADVKFAGENVPGEELPDEEEPANPDNGDNGGEEAHQAPQIHLAQTNLVVEQQAESAGYKMDASATQYAKHYKWEVVEGFGQFQLQEKQGSPTYRVLEGDNMTSPRAWVRGGISGKATYRLTVTNDHGAATRLITVQANPTNAQPEPGPDQTVTTWQPGKPYAKGDKVMYQGKEYRCNIPHTAQVDWYPGGAHSLWFRVQ